MANEVIAAIATPPGRGGIGVVRISGGGLAPMLHAIAGRDIEPRRATRADFRDADGALLDQGLVLYFRAPHSYTGEDVIELHGHGGPVVMQLLLQRCLALGARPAEPGEFTKRAFLNGKLDLAQAEGVSDLIEAATAEAARCSMRSLAGEFSQRIDTLVQQLIALRALIEAGLDFPEEDLELVHQADVRVRIECLKAVLAQVTEASSRGSLLREGIRVVLAGAPNVGKSSLMNCLAGKDVAIVTDVPGTTRDPIREVINLSGVPLHLTDTAGLREPRDKVEEIGIARTQGAVADADLVLWVSSASEQSAGAEPPLSMSARQLRVVNKIDLVAEGRRAPWGNAVSVSAKTGEGIDQLRAAILDAVGFRASGEGLLMARERHLKALRLATEHVHRADASVGQAELCAEELRLAQRALEAITGAYTADDLLGEIFSHFCIGK